MKFAILRRGFSWLADLAAVAAGFSLGALAIRAAGLTYATGGLSLAVSIAAFWAAVQSTYSGDDGPAGWFRLFLLGTGLSVLCQGVCVYLRIARPAPLLVLMVGGLLASWFVFGERRWWNRYSEKPKGGTLVVGFDTAVLELLPGLPPVIGVLNCHPAAVPPHLPVLGEPAGLVEAVATARPSVVLLAQRDWPAEVPPSKLVQLQRSGIRFETVGRLYERILRKVCWRFLDPRDFLFLYLRDEGRNALILQAVYGNLIGLTMLAVASPILLILAAAVWLSQGGGPVLESIECMGYRTVPFSRLRFRTRGEDGQETRLGRAMRKLHLDGLPQLINLVRGEMSLIGLPPVRLAFARRLIELIPAYRHRLSVLPGCLSWSRMQLRDQAQNPDEIARLEYDLYQVQQTSFDFDAELALRALNPARRVRERGA